jgi:hypothetical protein
MPSSVIGFLKHPLPCRGKFKDAPNLRAGWEFLGQQSMQGPQLALSFWRPTVYPQEEPAQGVLVVHWMQISRVERVDGPKKVGGSRRYQGPYCGCPEGGPAGSARFLERWAATSRQAFSARGSPSSPILPGEPGNTHHVCGQTGL